jgi:hypothetical protein
VPVGAERSFVGKPVSSAEKAEDIQSKLKPIPIAINTPFNFFIIDSHRFSKLQYSACKLFLLKRILLFILFLYKFTRKRKKIFRSGVLKDKYYGITIKKKS